MKFKFKIYVLIITIIFFKLNKTFNQDNNYNEVIIKNTNKKVTIYDAKIENQDTLDRSNIPASLPLPIIKIGKINSFTLANGLKVFVVENHKTPTISYSLRLNIYPKLEKEYTGLSNIAGELLMCGTTTKDKDQIDNEIDFLGGNLYSYSHGLNATTLKKNNKKILDLFFEILTKPSFPVNEMERIKKRTISKIISLKDNPDYSANNAIKVINYGSENKYGEVITENTINNITIEKCKEYYNTYFKPNVSYLVIVGDVNFEEIKLEIENKFNNWHSSFVSKSKYKLPDFPYKNLFYIIDKENAVQSYINVTYPIILYPNSDDILKLKILNTILGGNSSARLFTTLREKKGYTYGAYSSIYSDEFLGQFLVTTKVRNDVTDSSINSILEQVSLLKNVNITEEELNGAKNYIAGNFVIELENPSKIAEFAMNIDKYKLPSNYYDNYLETLNSINIDTIMAVAKRYLKPEKANIIIVGNKEFVTNKLIKNNGINKNQIYNCDVYGNIIREDKEEISCEKILKNYISNIINNDKIDNIKNTKQVLKIENNNLDLIYERYTFYPNKYMIIVKNGEDIIQKIIINNNDGIEIMNSSTKILSKNNLNQIKNELEFIPEIKYLNENFKLVYLGIKKVDSRQTHCVKIINEKENSININFYNIKNFLKVRSAIIGTKYNLNKNIIIDYKDYKDFDGIILPSLNIYRNNNKLITYRVLLSEINKDLDENLFNLK